MWNQRCEPSAAARRLGVALLIGTGLLLGPMLTMMGCGTDSNQCERDVNAPDGAGCVAVFNKLECVGKTRCGGSVSAADASACSQLAASSTCESNTFDDASGTCQLDGCACAGFEASDFTCNLTGCRVCGNVCDYQLKDIPDVQSCVTQAVDFDCTTNISYDAATQVCGLIGCLDCGH